MSRRRALVLGGLGTASLAGGLAGWFAQASQPTRDPAAADQAQGSWVGDTGARLGEPVPLESRDGRLQATLIAGPGARLAGRDTAALGYNATSPGPTLRARPGDVLALRLVNHLDQPTNLHTHGLRVSPGANSDNPFIQIAPGETFDYVFHIPPNHPAGTFWYHPHRHGTTADQLFGGLAGALLIMPDTPELAAAEDRVLLITDTTLDDAGRVAPAGPMAKMMGRQGALVLLNGQHQPVIPAVPAATQRWRLINGCASRILSLRLAGHQLTQIALDGSSTVCSPESYMRCAWSSCRCVRAAGRPPTRARAAARPSRVPSTIISRSAAAGLVG